MVRQNLCPLVNQRQHSSKIHSRIKSTLQNHTPRGSRTPEIGDQKLLETEDQKLKKRGIRIALKGGHEFYQKGYSKGENFHPRRTGLQKTANGQRKFLETLVSKRRFGDFAAEGKVTRVGTRNNPLPRRAKHSENHPESRKYY